MKKNEFDQSMHSDLWSFGSESGFVWNGIAGVFVSTTGATTVALVTQNYFRLETNTFNFIIYYLATGWYMGLGEKAQGVGAMQTDQQQRLTFCLPSWNEDGFTSHRLLLSPLDLVQ